MINVHMGTGRQPHTDTVQGLQKSLSCANIGTEKLKNLY